MLSLSRLYSLAMGLVPIYVIGLANKTYTINIEEEKLKVRLYHIDISILLKHNAVCVSISTYTITTQL